MGIRLSLATINVADIERSIAFYRYVLGLEVSERFDAGPLKIAMMGGREEARVELIEAPEMPEGPIGRGVRIGLVLDDISPIRAALGDALEEMDVPNPMFNFFETEDPDGYRIELMEVARQ